MITYFYISMLVVLSGLFSGLTIGLFTLNVTALQRKAKLGDLRAAKVLPERLKANQLLCTLLMGNVAVNAAIAILIEDVAGGLLAGILATVIIFLFGEILPQAFFSRFALSFGSKVIWLVKIIRFLLFPLIWPVATILDKLLGDEVPTIWSKRELLEIIKTHEDSTISRLDADEERILIGALSFSDLTAADIMTPKNKIKMLEASQKLNPSLIKELKQSGFTRFPVYQSDNDNICGIFLIKDIVGVNNLAKKTVKSFTRSEKLLTVNDTSHLDLLLNRFIRQRTHMAMVKNKFETLLGLVTLEDLIESILQRNITDETDTK